MSDIIKANLLPAPSAYNQLRAGARLLETASRMADEKTRQVRGSLASNIHSLRERARKISIRERQKSAKAQTAAELMGYAKKHKELISDSEQDCLSLCLSICREVIGKELKRNPASLVSRIRTAISRLCDAGTPRIYLNPCDIGPLKDRIRASLEEVSPAILEADDVAQGNARIETSSGTLEICIENHLEAVAEKLRSLLEERANA